MSDSYTPITQGLREYIERHPTMMHAVGLTDLLDNIDAIHRSLEEENESLREREQTLITLLHNDCDIDVSWDGLRKFWNIGLTEHGCLMRDRACKAEAENEQLRNASERGDDWIKLPVDAEAPSKQLADWLERRGLVTGPLDANGELWHSGDMSASNWGVIEGIYFENGVWFISGHDISAPWIRADSIVHYHPDTWERIIEDAVKLGFTDPDNEHLADKLVARCKALAGEDE